MPNSRGLIFSTSIHTLPCVKNLVTRKAQLVKQKDLWLVLLTGCMLEQVKALLREIPEIAKKYEYALNASYVEDNADVCWCPSVPHCGHAVRAEKDVFCEPRCRCGHRFCFACAGEPHSPCTCDM